MSDRYVEGWHIPGKQQVWVHQPDHRMTDWSISRKLGNVSWVQKAAHSYAEQMCHFLHMSNQFPGMSLNASTVSDAGTSIPSFPDLHCFQMHEEHGSHGIFFHVRDVKVVERT